jgi:hypothetical protein
MLVLTDDEVLARGLELVGFDEWRQSRVQKATNVKRFKDFYVSKPVVYAQLWEDLQMTNNAAARVAGGASPAS